MTITAIGRQALAWFQPWLASHVFGDRSLGQASPLGERGTANLRSMIFRKPSLKSSMSKKPIYKCICKGTKRENADPRASFNWLISKRATFKIFDDHVECGSWQIPFSDISDAVVYRMKHLFGTAPVIQLTTKDDTYQFGFNPWASPDAHMNISFEERKTKMKYSGFSIVLRVVGIACILYWMGQYFSG